MSIQEFDRNWSSRHGRHLNSDMLLCFDYKKVVSKDIKDVLKNGFWNSYNDFIDFLKASNMMGVLFDPTLIEPISWNRNLFKFLWVYFSTQAVRGAVKY